MVKTDGCESCHQLGDKATRTIPSSLGAFDTSAAAWDRRIQSAQVGSMMSSVATRMGRKRALAEYGDWTDRIKNGELPSAPPRPQGLERNVVITQWDWATPKEYFHDEISVDRRNLNSNPNGLVYGVHEDGSDFITVLDPDQEFVHAKSRFRTSPALQWPSPKKCSNPRRTGATSRSPSRTPRRTA